MKEREKAEVESFLLEMEGGVAKTLAECIVELAQFGSPTKINEKEFDALRSRRKNGFRKPGIISLMNPFIRNHNGSIPELIRIVASSSKGSNLVHYNALQIAPTCVRFLNGEIKMQDKKPVAEEALASPKSGVRATPPPPSQSEPRIVAAAGSA